MAYTEQLKLIRIYSFFGMPQEVPHTAALGCSEFVC